MTLKITARALLSMLFATLALTAAAISLSGLPAAAAGPQSSVEAPVQLAQSTSAILEGRSA